MPISKDIDSSTPIRTKRPDVAQRLKNKSNIEERTVSCSLMKRLGCALDDSCRELLLQEIDRWVLSTSQITHRLSIIFNRLLLYLLNRDLPLPTFNDSFFSGLALHGMKISNKKSKEGYSSLIEDFCDNEFNVEYGMYPPIKRQRGDCQAIVIASSRYKTNFKNTLHVPFYVRQLKYIQVWLMINDIDIDKRGARQIQCQINNWKDLSETNPVISRFIEEERRFLGIREKMNQEWLSTRTKLVLKYYHRILTFYTKHEQGKKFRLAPLCQIKCHFLTVDNTVLREILINVRKESKQKNVPFPEWISDDLDKKDMNIDIWKGIFNYNGLRRKRTFTKRIDTDGTKICFHFQMKKKKDKRRASIKKREKCTESSTNTKRLIAIDPGRVNLIMAYDTEKDRYFKLTRGYYYRACGMKTVIKKCNMRNLQLKGIYDAMSRNPTRSIDEADWFNYQQVINRNYNELWRMNATEERRREKFRVRRLKEKCLDRFFNQFQKKGEERPIIAYGGASLNPTGKGELSVPVKYVYEKCRYRYETKKEDERYTTKMHYKCQKEMEGVMVRFEHTRGLRWCSTCSELVSRDRNACKNIAYAYVCGEEKRPKYLCDTGEGEKRKKKPKRLQRVKSHTSPITIGWTREEKGEEFNRLMD